VRYASVGVPRVGSPADTAAVAPTPQRSALR